MSDKKYPIGGYAPGNYHNRCCTCERSFFGDKRAVQCEPCAIKDKKAFDALSPEEQHEVIKRNGEIAKKLFTKALHPSESAGVSAVWVKLGLPWPALHKTYIFRKYGNSDTAIPKYVGAYTFSECNNGKLTIENALECSLSDIEWLNESPSLSPDQHPHQSLFDHYNDIKKQIGELGYNNFIHSKEVEEYREWLRNDRYKHRIEWFEKQFPNGLYYKEDDGMEVGIRIITKQFLAEADAAYELPSPDQSGKVEITDHEHEKEVMMQAFDKVRQIFEKRSWIMQGRGSYPYNDDRYKEEVRYMYDEFDAIRKDTWSQIQSKTFEYRNKIIDQYKAESGKEEAVAFMNWTLESECQYSCSDENQWTNINDPTDSITTDQLYDIYNSKK